MDASAEEGLDGTIETAMNSSTKHRIARGTILGIIVVIPVVAFAILISFMMPMKPKAEATAVITLSKVDPALAAEREKDFIPWSDSKQAGDYWKKLASSNIPIFTERKEGGLRRSIYLPNPGTGYCTFSEMDKASLIRIHKNKLKIGDTVITAGSYRNARGETEYWALWAPRDKYPLFADHLKKYGLTKAEIEIIE